MALTVVWFITAIFSFVHLSPLISVKGKCLPGFQQLIVVYFKTLHFFQQQQQLLELKFSCLKLKGWKKCSCPWILLTKCSVTYCKSSHAETNVSIFCGISLILLLFTEEMKLILFSILLKGLWKHISYENSKCFVLNLCEITAVRWKWQFADVLMRNG